jgi:hypothetical protein
MKLSNGMKIATVAVISSLLLSACNTTAPLEIKTSEIQLQANIPDRPRPVRMRNIQYQVVTISNLEEFVKQYENGNNPVFYVLRQSDYENNTLNIVELRRYVQQQNSIIVYYENISTSN